MALPFLISVGRSPSSQNFRFSLRCCTWSLVFDVLKGFRSISGEKIMTIFMAIGSNGDPVERLSSRLAISRRKDFLDCLMEFEHILFPLGDFSVCAVYLLSTLRLLA